MIKGRRESGRTVGIERLNKDNTWGRDLTREGIEATKKKTGVKYGGDKSGEKEGKKQKLFPKPPP